MVIKEVVVEGEVVVNNGVVVIEIVVSMSGQLNSRASRSDGISDRFEAYESMQIFLLKSAIVKFVA